MAGPQGPQPDFPAHLRVLTQRCRATDGVTSLAFFGTSAAAGASRRDQWSDVDFTVFFRADRAAEIRSTWAFLPWRDLVVLEAREGNDGGIVVYDDGMLYEFGAGLPWPIRDPVRDIAVDGGDLVFADTPMPEAAAGQVRLFLAKLYIGVGRLRRGERAAAEAHIRMRAVRPLCGALRERMHATSGNPFDPVRRFEEDLPEVGQKLDAALDRDLESCARGLFDLAREFLEPGWDAFPSLGADAIARRLDWSEAR